MAILTVNPDFEDLLLGLNDLRLPSVVLEYADVLGGFALDDTLIQGDILLSATGLSVQTRSTDPADPTLYTFRITGNNIAPSATLQEFEAAIQNGTANGTITGISIDYGTTPIFQFGLAPGSVTLSSGAQSLELTGGFPVTLGELFNIAAIASGQAEGSLGQYGFTGLTLRDAGEVLLSVQDGDDLVITLEGYTLTLTDADFVAEDISAFLNLGRAQIAPDLTLFDAGGNVVPGERFIFTTDEPNAFRIAYENLAPGTYYAQVRASELPIADWQTQTGLYELFGSWWGPGPNANQPTFENQGDASANDGTSYALNSGSRFQGAINPVGDSDWIRIDFPHWQATYRQNNLDSGESVVFENALVLQVFGTGALEPVLENLPGVSFGSLTLTDPNGIEILRATEVDSFADFLEALDRFFTSVNLPEIGGLGLAFATGDPHLLTHDGLGYGFHAAGEYVLVRATNGRDFEVQSRMSPAGENVTANIAVAVRLDGADVMIAADGPALRVNGAVVALADGDTLAIGQDVIARAGNTYRLLHRDPDGGTSLVRVDIIEGRVDIGVGLSDYWQGNVEGLLGDFNGTIRNDLRLADGTLLTFPLVFGDDAVEGTYGLYGQFREDWRVDSDTTLFTYADGEGPDSFYLPDYPTRISSLDDFDPDARSTAEQQAIDAGLTPGTFAFNTAVLDLLVTGDDGFLQSALNVDNVLDEAGASAGDTFIAPVTSSGLEGLQALSGRLVDLSGDSLTGGTVTFQPLGRSVALTRLTRDGDSFSFDLSQGASGRLEATRPFTTGDPTITANDALDVLRLAVGLTPGFGAPRAGNFIAADINGDGQVTASDALDVLRAAVGLTSPNMPRWVFVGTEALDNLTLSASDTTFETGLTINGLSDLGSGLSMTGILLGKMEAAPLNGPSVDI